MTNKIKTFMDLFAWQKGHRLVLYIYKLTLKFPKYEQFGLSDQIRRAGVSITSNIAEGFSRQSIKEKKQFYSISLGSLTEVQNQLIIARDLKYINPDEFDISFSDTIEISKLINSLRKGLNKI